MNKRTRLLFSLFTFLFSLSAAQAADFPRGFFIEDLRRKPSVPAFYNLETHRAEPFAFKGTYIDFIDIVWDRAHGRVFFSAHTTRSEPFRVYMKEWPEGEERMIYENPTGPFRFLLSPDGERMALQVMGPSSFPVLAVYDWVNQKGTALGQGHSPDWSADSQKLLFLKIPQALPTWLWEYDVRVDTATRLIDEPVMEAVYTDDSGQIVLKTAGQSSRCDIFHLWNRQSDQFKPFSLEDPALCKKKKVSQRELAAFPGHRFFFFKESIGSRDPENQSLVVLDVWGGRMQSLPYETWNPSVRVVEEMSFAMSEEPLIVAPADGTGGQREIPQARFLRVRQ